MAETNHVVAHFADETILKGTTQDFYPNRPSFHLLPLDGSPAVEIVCRKLKALFFVRSLTGNSARPGESTGFPVGGPGTQGKKIAVLFKDGELLCGFSLAYVPGREGFFMTPATADTNNLRIYVINAAVDDIKTGREADALVEKARREKSRSEKNPLVPR